MRATIPALCALLALPGAALAQNTAPADPGANENGRYQFQPVPDGLARLDTRTGRLSICARKGAEWSCELAADERNALLAENERLKGELERLRRNPAAAEKPKIEVPSDQEIDRVLNVFDRFVRRFMEIMRGIEKDNAPGQKT